MDDIVVVEDLVDDRCMRRLHLMLNVDPTPVLTEIKTIFGGNEKFAVEEEAGAWHVRVEYPYGGPLDIECEGWPKAKRFVLWSLTGIKSVKLALFEAANKYEEVFKQRAQYAFMRKLPRGVENGIEVGDLMLFEAEWMVRNCVAVGWLYK